MSVSAYPLQWPAGRPRRTPGARKNGSFSRKEDNGTYLEAKKLTIAAALERLQNELDRLGGRHPVVSTNVETRVDGMPRSDRAAPADPGVAVYFQLAGKPHCLPCDTYTTVAANIAAIAAHIAASRAMTRHGVATVAEMFSGFAALHAPGKTPWHSVLGVRPEATREEIVAAHRRLATERHPDRGGSHEMMADLNRARDEALKERAP